jgi:hypothetical protein
MYMPTKKLKRGLRHSKKLRGGVDFFSMFGTTAPAANVKSNALAVKPNAPTAPTNGPLTIEQLNAKIMEIIKRLDALEAKS